MTMTTIEKELDILIRARYTTLIVETPEETRAINTIARIAIEQNKKLFVWAVTTGLCKVDGTPAKENTNDPQAALQAISESKDPAIYILKDFHPYMAAEITGGITVIRMLRDLIEHLKATTKTIILLTPVVRVPNELKTDVTILSLPLPGRLELREVLRNVLIGLEKQAYEDDPPVVGEIEKNLKAKPWEEFVQAFAERDNGSEIKSMLKSIGQWLLTNSNTELILNAGLGLTENEYENVIAKSIIATGSLSPDVVISEKEQIIKKSGLLEYRHRVEDMSDIGGLGNLKAWVRSAKKRYTKEAEKFGLEQPKGILLIGPPGTGKSLSAKAMASELQVPLIRFDISSLVSKYYGETVSQTRQALKLGDAIAPCVMWLDEIEKMFSTGQGGMDGHEETMRAMSVILTHMEESKAPVLRIGTCNNPFGLKPEFMQRFERIFFVDVPTKEERMEIFKIHLAKVNRNPENFEIEALADSTEGFVGREIRIIVKEALSNAFNDGAEDVTTEHLIAEAERAPPMSVQKKDEVDRLRKWAEVNCINASAVETKQKSRARKLEIKK